MGIARDEGGTAGIDRETELLLSCARVEMDPATALRIVTLVREEIDWSRVIRAALHHGLTPLLFAHLNAICPGSLPRLALNHLRSHVEKNAIRNLFLAKELRAILAQLEAHGIAALPFNGLVLGACLYGNLALRELSDLHILIHQRDILRASEVLLAAEYHHSYGPSCARDAVVLRSQPDHLYIREDRRVWLELHWAIGPNRGFCGLDPGSLWEDREPTKLGEADVSTVSREDLLVMLCVHGAAQLWTRLGWIVDVGELIRTAPHLDWGRVTQRARAAASERILSLGLLLAHDLLGTALPEELLHPAKSDAACAALADEVTNRLFQKGIGSPDFGTTVRFHLQVKERLVDRLRYISHGVCTPTAGDRAFLLLPESLSASYALLRPIRLIAHLFFGGGHRLDLAPFVPTPIEVIDRMLAVADLAPTDVLYDLGCGDGRIVILASERYGVRGVGVDIDPERVAEAKAAAHAHGVDHRTTFLCQDAKLVDVSDASVVVLYLNSSSGLRLLSELRNCLQPSARVVLHDFDIWDDFARYGWCLLHAEMILDGYGLAHKLEVWRVEPISSGATRQTADPIVSAAGSW